MVQGDERGGAARSKKKGMTNSILGCFRLVPLTLTFGRESGDHCQHTVVGKKVRRRGTDQTCLHLILGETEVLGNLHSYGMSKPAQQLKACGSNP